MEGKTKGKISSKREGEEGKEGWRRDKEGPVRPNKDRLYSSEGQMGVLFMVSPYTLRGGPLGLFKAEEVCVCVCVHTVFPGGSSTHLGQSLVPKYPHFPAHCDKHTTQRSWMFVCLLDVSVFCHFYSLKLLIIPEVW